MQVHEILSAMAQGKDFYLKGRKFVVGKGENVSTSSRRGTESYLREERIKNGSK